MRYKSIGARRKSFINQVNNYRIFQGYFHHPLTSINTFIRRGFKN